MLELRGIVVDRGPRTAPDPGLPADMRGMSPRPTRHERGWDDGALLSPRGVVPAGPERLGIEPAGEAGERPAAVHAPGWALVDQLSLLVYVTSSARSTAVTYMSPRIEAILGHSLDEMTGPGRFRQLMHPDDRVRALAEHADALDAGRPVSIEYRLLARDGSVVWIHDEAQFVAVGDDGHPLLEGYCLDITGHKRIEEELRASEEQFRTVVANIPGVVYRCACDADWTMQFMSEYIEELCGYPAGDFIGNRARTYGSIIHPEDRPYVVEGIDEALAEGSPYSLQYRVVHVDGSARWVAEHGKAILDPRGERLWLDGVIFDVTQRTLAEQARDRAEEQLKRQAEINRHQALHDPLTGLPNRTLFHDRVSQALTEAQREEVQLAVLMIDLDRFKEINDTLGHASGDRLLQEVGARLLNTLRASDSIARLGGDEFGLLLPGTCATSVIDVVERIREAVDRPCVLDGLSVSVEASVGIAFFPDHGADVNLLLQRADVAMYVAKEGNSGYAVYNADDDRHEPKRLTLVGELRTAIDERQLMLYYQPKVELRSGRVTGVEALVRWRHPQRGIVMPDEFIPVAQETGLIKPLTLYVIDEALRQCQAWCRDGHELAIAVNISPRSLIDVEFPADVARLLGRWDVAPELLELELTEGAIVADPERATLVLERLSGMGVRLAVDDFGTGYSSLAYLKRLPIDEIKIDRSFVTNMTSSKDDAVIVRSTIDLGRNLGLDVVAEGVEDAEVWACLERLGCDVAQGYYMSRPIPAGELTSWLEGLPGADEAPRWHAESPGQGS